MKLYKEIERIRNNLQNWLKYNHELDKEWMNVRKGLEHLVLSGNENPKRVKISWDAKTCDTHHLA